MVNIQSTPEQLEYLQQYGVRNPNAADASDDNAAIMLTDPDGVRELLLVLNKGQAQLVGSCVVSNECQPHVAETIAAHPDRYEGVLVTGSRTRLGGTVALRGVHIDGVFITGDGVVNGTTITGVVHVEAKGRKPLIELGKTEANETLSYNPNLQRVEASDGSPIGLTRIENGLLHALLQSRGSVVSRDELLGAVWGGEEPYVGDKHVVDVHVSNLRRKLEQQGLKGLIGTTRGVGFFCK